MFSLEKRHEPAAANFTDVTSNTDQLNIVLPYLIEWGLLRSQKFPG